MRVFNLTISFITILFLLPACNDKELLAESTDSSLLTINSVENARSVLDNTATMRETPGLGELSADDFYFDDSSSTNNIVELNAFLWKPDIFQGQPLYGDWTIPYRQIFFANSILDAIPKLSGSKEEVDQIEGSARFFRAYALYGIVLEFANLYSSNAATDLGIPVRLSPDPEVRSNRATVEATYNQIINDVKQALLILPKSIDNSKKNRPAKAAGYALLARIYLTMADYSQAKLYADSCLQLHSALIDYNNVSTNNTLPFTGNNDEVIYQSNLLSSITLFYNDTYFVENTLYNSYSSTDLRKEIYFLTNNQGKAVLKPGYSGSSVRFSGLATDEVLLIRAESNARTGNKEDAMTDLNKLLITRWKTGTYVPLTAGSATEALELILVERRKSLVGRGLRWIDIRRFNRENRGVNLKRLMNGKEYTLPAGDNRFVLPIPPDVISSVQGMPQNPR
jgi:tetratricopeptide (TPR) repeat protein